MEGSGRAFPVTESPCHRSESGLEKAAVLRVEPIVLNDDRAWKTFSG
jgi:hypothetical protein